MGSQTVEIQSFISQDPLAVLLPVSCSCERALREVASKLEIRGDSLEVFALFCGKLGHPIRVLQPSDTVPMATELSLQRWYMRSDEAKVIKQDDKAIHCLYMEAKHKLTTGDLQPTAEQMEELETFSDPLFPTERQFLEVARQVSGYNSVVVRQCIVNEEIHDNSCVLSVGSLVTVSMDIEGLSVRGKTGDLHWPWTVVRRWKRVTSSQTNVIKFEVCLQKQNAGMLCWISLETPQAVLLFQTAGAMCAEVKKQQDLQKALLAEPKSSMAGRFYDPLKEWMDNTLFASTPRFSSIK